MKTGDLVMCIEKIIDDGGTHDAPIYKKIYRVLDTANLPACGLLVIDIGRRATPREGTQIYYRCGCVSESMQGVLIAYPHYWFRVLDPLEAVDHIIDELPAISTEETLAAVKELVLKNL